MIMFTLFRYLLAFVLFTATSYTLTSDPETPMPEQRTTDCAQGTEQTQLMRQHFYC